MTSGNLVRRADRHRRRRRAGPARRPRRRLAHPRPPDPRALRRLGDPRVDGRESPVRRSRGQAPLPLDLPFESPAALAVGADLKNTFCLAEGRLAWMSAHVGDMDDLSTLLALRPAEQHLEMLDRGQPDCPGRRPAPGVPVAPLGAATTPPAGRSRACSTTTPTSPPRWPTTGSRRHPGARRRLRRHRLRRRRRRVGRRVPGRRLRVVRAGRASRVRRAPGRRRRRTQPLPDGALPPAQRRRRLGPGACRACVRPTPIELALLDRQLDTGFGCAPTSSMGRLFDAVASIAGICHRAGYDAQAAMELEALARRAGPAEGYRFGVGESATVDPAPRSVAGGRAADVLRGRRRRRWSPHGSSRASSTWSSPSLARLRDADRPDARHPQRRRLPQPLPHRALRPRPAPTASTSCGTTGPAQRRGDRPRPGGRARAPPQPPRRSGSKRPSRRERRSACA